MAALVAPVALSGWAAGRLVLWGPGHLLSHYWNSGNAPKGPAREPHTTTPRRHGLLEASFTGGSVRRTSYEGVIVNRRGQVSSTVRQSCNKNQHRRRGSSRDGWTQNRTEPHTAKDSTGLDTRAL
ncbi:hypothetical protein M430DRAFT_26508 [Amorphotheca resinae ATCC 22711]|uniref:Secreted protein n=1 Tax=Amorphotheca resinae ATCC 22711 TaxID=857342 RepID=A0A2T3B5E3_AMORE|nr:hypothetical protein M430DRAFT_26508 [Amorphotheca resinae ATCC 22711]PSS21971.1 hypothetical protein M430DRAFT_26508 [Amorphotheca resinae ATCC 22711]